MLAELPAPTSFQSLGWIVAVLGGLALILNQGWAFISNVRGPRPVPPQPPNGELELQGQQLEMRVAELERNREEDRKVSSERRKAIYDQMNTDRATFMAEVKDIYERIERHETQMHQTVRQLPHEIIATLRNTGVIK